MMPFFGAQTNHRKKKNGNHNISSFNSKNGTMVSSFRFGDSSSSSLKNKRNVRQRPRVTTINNNNNNNEGGVKKKEEEQHVTSEDMSVEETGSGIEVSIDLTTAAAARTGGPSSSKQQQQNSSSSSARTPTNNKYKNQFRSINKNNKNNHNTNTKKNNNNNNGNMKTHYNIKIANNNSQSNNNNNNNKRRLQQHQQHKRSNDNYYYKDDDDGSIVRFARYRRMAHKVHKTQFRMDFPLIKQTQASPKNLKSSVEARIKNLHRVPLIKASAHHRRNNNRYHVRPMEELIQQLQRHKVRDEIISCREELVKLDREISALEEDRTELEQEYLCLPEGPQNQQEQQQHQIKKDLWDLDSLIQHNRQQQRHDRMSELQRIRGRCLTLYLSSPKTVNVLRTKLCDKNTKRKIYHTKVTIHDSDVVAQLAHISLLPGIHPSSGGRSTSFFFSLDDDRATGHVPVRLLERMRQHGLGLDMLSYLACGPRGTYFAQFRSGHVWWGMLDPDLEQIISDWHVWRIGLGEAKPMGGDNNVVFTWLVVGRDGRVAYKNLPRRFQLELEQRLADDAAPMTISFGSDGAYFCRYLNGDVDYCLPTHVSELCQYILHRGGTITNVVLHPELSKDCIVRHTELKS